MEIDWVSWIQLSAIWLPLDYHFHSTCLSLGDHLTIISSSWRDSIDLMSSTPHPLDIHSTSTQHALNIQLKSTWHRSKVIQLTRGCSGPVYWNKGVSNSTRGCSNIQVQNNPVLNFVWLFFEFHWLPFEYHFTTTWLPLECDLGWFTIGAEPPECVGISWVRISLLPLDFHLNTILLPMDFHLKTTWLPIDFHLTTTWLPPNFHLNTTWLPLDYHLTVT